MEKLIIVVVCIYMIGNYDQFKTGVSLLYKDVSKIWTKDK